MRTKTPLTIIVAIICVAIVVLGLSAVVMNRLKKLVEAYDTTKEQLAICQRNLVTFKNLEEKDVTDIRSYILANYKRVPDIVAKEIAIRTVELASKHGIAVPILVGMMEVESDFGPHGVSKKHARGLMQVRWTVWGATLKEELSLTDYHQLHQIKSGIEAGIVVFKYYMKQNDDNISKALYAYVGKNKSYVTKVYSAMGRFVLHGVSTIPPVGDYDAG